LTAPGASPVRLSSTGADALSKSQIGAGGLNRIDPPQHRMKRNYPIVFWMGAAFAMALALTGATFAVIGIDIVQALRLTARWSFLLFWLAYTGGAIATLFGPTFKPIATRAREFGLAYAAAQLVHLGLVVWLFQVSLRPPLSGRPFAFFVVAIIWTYLLAVFSFGGIAKTLGSRGWRALRIVGVNYILVAFAWDFVPPALHSTADYGVRRLAEYTPFAAMCIVAPLLVLAAAANRRLGMRYSSARLGQVAN
jgi:hypothetical protein